MVNNQIRSTIKFVFIIVSLNFIYWSVTHLHVYYCAPLGFLGILSTPIMMGSPICQFLVSIISHTTEIYCTIWLSLIGILVTSSYSFISNLGFIDNTQKT